MNKSKWFKFYVVPEQDLDATPRVYDLVHASNFMEAWIRAKDLKLSGLVVVDMEEVD